MQKITKKTPCKLGPAVKFDGHMADSPSAFKYRDKWYMYYVRIANDSAASGCETHMSVSGDPQIVLIDGV